MDKVLTVRRKRRLLISQDRHEVWLVIAEYDAAYQQYIKLGRDASPLPRARVLFQGSPLAGKGEGKRPVPLEASRQTQGPPQPTVVPGYEPGFLVMHTYGPWVTEHAFHMRELCRHVASLTLQLCPPEDYFY